MKYKIGDKVLVRTDLEINNSYSGVTFLEKMAQNRGKVAKITAIDSVDCYKIDIDDNNFWYEEHMFESLKNFSKKNLQSGMVVEVEECDGRKYMGLIVKCDYKYNGKEDFVLLDEPDEKGFSVSTEFNENLTTSSLTITKVYQPKCASSFEGLFSRKDNLELIWDRYAKPKVTELTLQQIADKYGISVSQLRIKNNE